MKKLIIAALVVATAAFAQAASVKWGYTGTAAENGYSVYLFANEVTDASDSFAALIGDSIGSGTVVGITSRGSTTYAIAAKTTTDEAIVKGTTTDLFFVLVANADATEYKYGKVNVASNVYGEMDPVGATVNLTNASFTSTGTIGGTPGPAVPEPTSGLLLLLGMAGLALRRKQK